MDAKDSVTLPETAQPKEKARVKAKVREKAREKVREEPKEEEAAISRKGSVREAQRPEHPPMEDASYVADLISRTPAHRQLLKERAKA